MSSLALSWLSRQHELNAPFQEGPQRIGPGGIPDMSDMRGRLFGVPGFHRWSDRKKVRKLREMAEAYGNDPRMRFFTVNSVLRPAGATDFRNYRQVAETLLKAVQDAGTLGIMYTNEPNEQLQSPWWTLKVRTGDCDDMSLLLAAMAHSVRLPWRFVLAGTARGGRARWAEGGRMPRGFRASHIYLDLGWPPFSEGKKDAHGRPVTQWAPAEPTLRGLPLGHDVVLHGIPGQGQRLDLGGGVAGHTAGPSWGGFTNGAYGDFGGTIYSRRANWGDAALASNGSTGGSTGGSTAEEEVYYLQPTNGALAQLQDKPLVGIVARAVASLDASLILAEAIGAVIQAVIVSYALSKLKL
jgi:hypothetical protein